MSDYSKELNNQRYSAEENEILIKFDNFKNEVLFVLPLIIILFKKIDCLIFEHFCIYCSVRYTLLYVIY